MSAVRYPAAIAIQARELHDSGWNACEIRRILRQEHGLQIAETTIRRWTDADFARRRDESNRRHSVKVRAQQWTFALPGAQVSPEYRAAFMARLRQERVPMTSIAKVSTILFGERVTRDQVVKTLERAA